MVKSTTGIAANARKTTKITTGINANTRKIVIFTTGNNLNTGSKNGFPGSCYGV
ncbi:hypothetical protein [Mucilaginibacter sp.]|uniref:hypothetical protein n=1 Tax=Mucilaginibacter sp. TaxID=1882438 RepID=UPI00261B8432|nr:hypothetical protein [Mucilaginibacter sp.]